MQNHPEIEYLFSLSSRGWKLGLDKITELLEELGNPHQQYKTIHVAGTNGKGSTCAMLTSILVAQGYRTGLFTSPHLIDVTERIRCNNVDISYPDLIELIQEAKPYIEKYECTFFEAVTAIGFLYFARQKVDVAVIEVGLGGRLDATNVIAPVLSIITEIEHDHTKQLGRSREKIAYEKGGIIKSGVTCLTNTRHKIVREILASICVERKSPFVHAADFAMLQATTHNLDGTTFSMSANKHVYKNLKLSLLGDYQLENALLAVTAARLLNDSGLVIQDDAIYQGLADVHWPGRLQVYGTHPLLILDVAHNASGSKRLVETIQRISPGKTATIVFGVCDDKNYRSMLQSLNAISKEFIFVKANTYRALSTHILMHEAEKFGKPMSEFQNVIDGMDYATSHVDSSGFILGTGSHYTVGEILKYHKNA
ncbi:bifunctional folylpolyglutamate synthase/dihydrofolate synthase [candidate division KSB1 bacterium]|nr:bifunctional folylpolyglutamate synthase/dihydrofolate synthase [candidate division KSB1 bacterium]